jgi:hypothetical protein
MSYPRKSATILAANDYCREPDWDAMVDAANGMTIAAGVTIQYPYSFIVRNVGGVYDAIDGNGVLTYGGSADAGGVDGDDAAAVIQEATDYLTTGGRIFFSKGSYLLLRAIDYKSAVYYEGEGKGRDVPNTVFTVPDGSTHAMFSNSAQVIYGGVKNINFQGNGALTGNATGNIFEGGKVVGTGEYTIENCCFIDAGNDAIVFTLANSEANKFINLLIDYAGRYGIFFDHSNSNIVRDSSVNHTTNVGIYNYVGAGNVFNNTHVLWCQDSGMVNNLSYRTMVHNCKFDNNYNHGVMDTNTTNNMYTSSVFTDNSIVGANQKDGLYFTGTSAKFIVMGNTMMDTRNPKLQRYGIHTDNTTNYAIITDNVVADNLTPMLLSGGTVSGGVQGNLGYLSHNTGSAAASGVEQTIAHGLGEYPTSVVVTPWNSATVSNIHCDATNIYCTVSAGAFNWRATRG